MVWNFLVLPGKSIKTSKKVSNLKISKTKPIIFKYFSFGFQAVTPTRIETKPNTKNYLTKVLGQSRSVRMKKYWTNIFQSVFFEFKKY